MLKIKQVLFLMFGVTSFIIFYMGFLNFVTTNDQLMGMVMLIFSSMVSIGTLIGALFISKQITVPIESLMNKMNEFSATNKIQKNTNSDIGIKELQYLHKSFENMAGIVGSTIKKEKKLNKQFQDIDKRKVEFMSMISHELKTPIMPILGYIQLLKKEELLGKLNPQQLDAIDEIYLATTRLQKLIQDVLTAQKIDLERLSISKSRLESNQIIDTVYNAFTPICKMKGVQLKREVQRNQQIFSDPDRINQIFSNLISNALEFVPENNAQIQIGSYEEKDMLVFFVKDNGIGIPKDEQKNIFKKFYQVDTSSKRKKEGSGLGLVICEGIIKNLGGSIWVQSNIGKGTTFYFSLSKEKIQVKNF